MDSKDCLLPTYGELTVDQVKKINENSYVVQHKGDELIFKQDKPVSHLKYLQKGLVKLFMEINNEKTIILKITAPGNYIGILSVFYDPRYKYSATALEESEIVYTDIGVIREIISENGRYALNLMKSLSTEGFLMIDKMINLSQKQVPGRIAQVLLFFAQEIYKSNSYDLPVSRQDLADLVSSTKESVSRTLTEFKNDRMIEIDERKIVLKSLDLIQVLSKLG